MGKPIVRAPSASVLQHDRPWNEINRGVLRGDGAGGAGLVFEHGHLAEKIAGADLREDVPDVLIEEDGDAICGKINVPVEVEIGGD